MKLTPLTLTDLRAWATLLAVAFQRTSVEMEQLLNWLHMESHLVSWGVWDGEQLAAQYTCRLTRLQLPDMASSVLVGMSINMAVHPSYRGQGLVKQAASPVYETITRMGGIAGVGFSNAEGVQVDRNSKGYGYRVVGQMRSVMVGLTQRHYPDSLSLSDDWSLMRWDYLPPTDDYIRFENHPVTIHHRYMCHPWRHYQFGVWNEDGITRGLVIYRPIRIGGVRGAALLGAYGEDRVMLLARWAGSLRQAGLHFIHVLLSPQSPLLHALQSVGRLFTLPYTRSPYFLTVKPLSADIPRSLFDFERWDCMGGDIL